MRLPTYEFEDAELRGAVDRLLTDGELRSRMTALGRAIRAEDGTTRAADLIEAVARAWRSARRTRSPATLS